MYDWASSPGVSNSDLRSPGPFSILEDRDIFPGHFPGKITHPLLAQHHPCKPPPPDLPWRFPGKLGLAVCLPYAIKHCAYSRHIVARDFTESHKNSLYFLFTLVYLWKSWHKLTLKQQTLENLACEQKQVPEHSWQVRVEQWEFFVRICHSEFQPPRLQTASLQKRQFELCFSSECFGIPRKSYFYPN